MYSTASSAIALVCAPAGSGFREAFARLVNLLRTELGEADVAFEDVEDVLCDGRLAAEALRGRIVTGQKITMREVTRHLTRGEVINLWGSALADATNKLQRARSARIRLLACHLNLYGGKRREFYSPIDVPSLKEAGISHLLLLIDDIFDMYARLTTHGHLYDEAEGLRHNLEDAWEAEGKEGHPRFSMEIEDNLSLEWKIRILSSLLAWRHSEMILAESVASQLGGKYLVFGTKQMGKAAVAWLLGEASESVYLSHPISRPRRTKRRSERWPDVVAEFNQLQYFFLAQNIAAIMPTAIDEYRLTYGTLSAKEELRPRLPILDSRWPLPASDPADTLYFPPSEDAPEYTYRLMREEISNDGRWSVWLRSLESQIMAEVPFRDHHLVVCNKHILIYRPCYEEGKFSAGVKAEILHWADLCAIDQTRRAVFIHFDEDLCVVIDRLSAKGEHKQNIRRRLVLILHGKGLSLENAERTAEAILTGPQHSLLDEGPDLTQVGERDDLCKRAQVAALGDELTSGQFDNPAVAIWLLKDADELAQRMGDISQFLIGKVVRPNDWEEKYLLLEAGKSTNYE
jgi:hypothetical protein